jgi:hypothetical protein
VRTANLDGVVDASAEAVRIGDWLEVARASKLLGAEALRHLAFELRDVTLLGCLDEDSLYAEALKLAAMARPRSGSRSALERPLMDRG